MDKEKGTSVIQQVADSFEDCLRQHVKKMIVELKKTCSTYGDVERELLRMKQDFAWTGRRACLPLIDEVKKALGDEKDRLLVASSPSYYSCSTENTADVL